MSDDDVECGKVGVLSSPLLEQHQPRQISPQQQQGHSPQQQYHQQPTLAQYAHPPQQYHQAPPQYGQQQMPPPQYYHQQQHQQMQMQQQGVMMAPMPPQQYPAQMGQPQPQTPPAPAGPPGVLYVHYLPPSRCGCCGGQPGKRGSLAIAVDGQNLPKIEQGGQGSWPIHPGVHRITFAKSDGLLGAIGSFFSSGGGESKVVTVMPGSSVHITLYWKQHSAGNSRYHAHIRLGQP